VTLSPPGGTYPAGSIVTVTATPGPNAVFNGFTGALTGTTTPQQLLIDGNKTIGASFTQHFTLSVTTNGPGAVTLNPPTGPYAPGTSVTVTAVPNVDSAFTGFTGDLSGTTNPQPIVMNANKAITASFGTLYDVNVSAVGPGTVTLSPPGGTYVAGTVVTVTATPGANAVFSGWSGALTGTTTPQLLTVDADKSVAASFTQHHTLTVATSGPGAVTLDPPGGAYPAGTVVSVTALADADSAFTGWSGDLASADNPLLVSMDADRSATAHFATLFDLSVATTGPGSVALDPPGGTYPAGSVVSVSAVPEPGAILDAFEGSLSGNQNPQLLTVDGDEAVSASFSFAFYTLTATANPGGTVTVDPPTGPYPAGTVVSVTAVPGANRAFGGWSGDASGFANPLELVMDGDKSVQASFNVTGGSPACGIGPELVAALPLLAWLHRRRRR
jgi:hypothetical protein